MPNNCIIVQVHNAVCPGEQHLLASPPSFTLFPFLLISSIMSDFFICHTSVIVGTMYAFCIDEYVLTKTLYRCMSEKYDNFRYAASSKHHCTWNYQIAQWHCSRKWLATPFKWLIAIAVYNNWNCSTNNVLFCHFPFLPTNRAFLLKKFIQFALKYNKLSLLCWNNVIRHLFWWCINLHIFLLMESSLHQFPHPYLCQPQNILQVQMRSSDNVL